MITDNLIYLDKKADYIPFISTAVNLFHIFEKAVLRIIHKNTPTTPPQNNYFFYISQKTLLRCIILLVPILGNCIIYLYDIKKQQEAHKQQEACRKQQEASQKNIRESLVKFIKTKTDSFLQIFSSIEDLSLTQYWSFNRVLRNAFLQIDPQEECVNSIQLKNVLEKRSTLYKGVLSAINEIELLQEAKIAYCFSFSNEEEIAQKLNIQNNTLEEMLSLIRERVSNATLNLQDYQILEMKLILDKQSS